MLVKDYMESNIATVNADTLLSEADRIMKRSRLRRLVVVNNGMINGLLTRYFFRQIRCSDRTSGTNNQQASLLDVLRVKDVMQRNVMTVSPETPIQRLTTLAQDNGTEAFIVVENRQPVGVITILDILGLTIEDFGFIGQRDNPVLYVTCTADSLPGIIYNADKFGAVILSITHLEPADGENRYTIYLDTETAEEMVDMLMAQKPQRTSTKEDLVVV